MKPQKEKNVCGGQKCAADLIGLLSAFSDANFSVWDLSLVMVFRRKKRQNTLKKMYIFSGI